MPEQNTAQSYYAQPDEHYWSQGTLPKDEIEIVSTPPAYTGKFKKGYDPRRHKFTRDECSRGFWNAITSIITRHPNAIMPDGRHIACNFLRSKAEVF